MSNLSELLPAGAGAKSASFVASGTLGSGVTVALKADGTVEAISGTPEAVGTATIFNTSQATHIGSTYDSFNNKVVIAYMDTGNSQYGTAIVGTVTGSSISFGSPVVFESAATEWCSLVFDSNSNKVVIAYRDSPNADYGTAIVGTVSGTSISFGSATVYNTGTTDHTTSTFDSNSNKVVIAYRNISNSQYGTAIVGTVSGTSISFGSAVVFESAASIYCSAAYDAVSQKVVIGYTDSGNSGYGTAVVGTVSGTSISFGSPVVCESLASYYISVCFAANKIVYSYSDWGNSLGKSAIGTVSGTTITFSSPTVFVNAKAYNTQSVYDSSANKIVIAYRDNGNLGYGTVIAGSVQTNSLSFDSAAVFESALIDYIATAYDSNENKVVISYRDTGNLNYGTSVTYSPLATNNTDFIGITDQAIADTATGAVIVQGGVSDKVSSLTTGSDYYVQDDGTLSTTASSVPAGRALSSTSILLEG